MSAFWISFTEGGPRRLTPATEEKYKEGLSWYPDGSKLTYMYYGPQDGGAQIRWAYLDGRTELFFDQEDHWDYVGVWAPDGQRFYFSSSLLTRGATEVTGTHVYHLATAKIDHALEMQIPFWSADRATMVWVEHSPRRHFAIMENIE